MGPLVDLGTATASPGDPRGYCLDASAEHTVWFRWTAENDGTPYVRLSCTPGFGIGVGTPPAVTVTGPLIETAGELADLLGGGG